MEETFDLDNVFLVVNDYETIFEGIGMEKKILINTSKQVMHNSHTVQQLKQEVQEIKQKIQELKSAT